MRVILKIAKLGPALNYLRKYDSPPLSIAQQLIFFRIHCTVPKLKMDFYNHALSSLFR